MEQCPQTQTNKPKGQYMSESESGKVDERIKTSN